MAEESIDNVLYVHLANDGGIFTIRGDTGEEAWITRDRLRQELEKVKDANGMVLYSRDDPKNDPSEIAFESFKLVPELELPVKLTDEPHPSTRFGGSATTLMAAAYNGDDEVAADLVERARSSKPRTKTARPRSCTRRTPARQRSSVSCSTAARTPTRVTSRTRHRSCSPRSTGTQK